MKQYIDKETIVVEIKRRIKEIEEIGTYLSPKGILTNLLCYLDTHEVKEVDLEKEIDEVIHNYKVNDHQHSSICSADIEWIAEHFFGLGLKAQKGE